jgi:hypothetical protein
LAATPSPAVKTRYPAACRISRVTFLTKASSSTSRTVSTRSSHAATFSYVRGHSWLAPATLTMSRSITTLELPDAAPQCMKMNALRVERIEHISACAFSRIILGIDRKVEANSELFYFGLLRIVPYGSSRILWVPAGAVSRNEDSSPSAKTRPNRTGWRPVVIA